MADNANSLVVSRPPEVGFSERVQGKAQKDKKKQAALEELTKLYKQVVAEVMQLGAGGKDAELAAWLRQNLVSEVVIPELKVVYSKDAGLFQGPAGHEAARDALKRALFEIAGLEKNEAGGDVDTIKFFIEMPGKFELKKHKAAIELKAAKPTAAPGQAIEVDVQFSHLDEVELKVDPDSTFKLKPALLKQPGKVILTGDKPGKATLLATGKTGDKPGAEAKLEVECLSPSLNLTAPDKEAFVGEKLSIDVGFANLTKVRLTLQPAGIFELKRPTLAKPGKIKLRGLKPGKATLIAEGIPKGGKAQQIPLHCKLPELTLKADKKVIEPGEKAAVQVDFKGVGKVRFKVVPAGFAKVRPAELSKPGGVQVIGSKDGKFELKAEALIGGRVSKVTQTLFTVRSKTSLKLKGLRAVAGPGDWVAYHHSIFYAELHTTGVRQVVLEVNPKKNPLPMICGIWKSEAPGSIVAKQMIAGGIGDNHKPHARCTNTVGHGAQWVQLWGKGASTGKVTVDLPEGIDRCVVGIYPRYTNTYTLSVSGTGAHAKVRDQLTLRFNNAHPHPGD